MYNLSDDKYWQISAAALAGIPSYSIGYDCDLLLRNKEFAATNTAFYPPTKEIYVQRNIRTTTHSSPGSH